MQIRSDSLANPPFLDFKHALVSYAMLVYISLDLAVSLFYELSLVGFFSDLEYHSTKQGTLHMVSAPKSHDRCTSHTWPAVCYNNVKRRRG